MAIEAETGKETQAQDQVILPEVLKGPEDEGSLASIIEQSRHRVLTEHPTAAGVMGAFEPRPEEEEETPAEEIASSEEAPGEEKPPEASEEPPKFQPKHATWEETEKARLEAEQKMHAATEETARTRRELEELRQKGVEKEAVQPPEPPAGEVKVATREERKAQLVAVAKVANAKALAKINEIPEFDAEGNHNPQYAELAAEAWAEANAEALLEAGISSAGLSREEVAQLVKEQLQAEEEAKRQKDEEDRQKQADINARTQAEELATDAGLNMEEGSADYRLFWNVAGEVPEELKAKPGASPEEKKKAFTAQVQWAVDKVRGLKGEMVQNKPGADKQAQEVQRQNTVLERGSSRTTQTKKPSEPEPYTLGGILNQQMNQRRI